MGNQFGKVRETLSNNAETAEEAKTGEETEAGQPAEDSGMTQDLGAQIQGQVAQLVCSITEELVLNSGVEKVDAEPEPVAKETPAPVQPKPLVSLSQSSAPELEPVAEAPRAPEPVPEPLPEPEPVSKPEPVQVPDPIHEPLPEPEPVSTPDPVPEPEAEVEVVSEPISQLVLAATEAVELKTDLLSQESLPEPAISSPPLINLGAPEEDAQPVDIPPSPAPVDAKEPADILVTEECQKSAEISVIPTFEPENREEASESGEKAMEAKGGVHLEQLVSDVSDDSLSGLLKNLELKGNDLVADLVPADVQIPDDVSTSTELM